MRTVITAIFLIALSPVFAQKSYTDSLLSYQLKYKTELTTIIQNDTAFVRFYPVNEKYRVTAKVEILAGQAFFPMATSGTGPKDAIKFAKLSFTLQSKSYTLYAYRLAQLMGHSEYRDNFFIPFTDSLSGIESYGGGKYIDFKTGDISAEKTLVIDFNHSYNPYCAFVTGYNCPIPPKENDLVVAVYAGEKAYGKGKH